MGKFTKAMAFDTGDKVIRFTPDELNEKVSVTCYRSTKIMPRGRAIKLYIEAMSACDPRSNEFSRYLLIVTQLLSRKQTVSD